MSPSLFFVPFVKKGSILSPTVRDCIWIRFRTSCLMMLLELLPQKPLLLAPQLSTTAVFEAAGSPEQGPGGVLKQLSGVVELQPCRFLLNCGQCRSYELPTTNPKFGPVVSV